MKKMVCVLTVITFLFAPLHLAWAVSEIDLYFPPKWKETPAAAEKVADGLSRQTGIKIIPRIAGCYPEILSALTQRKPVLAYVGSMVQTIIWSRDLGRPLFQAFDHKQFYGGILLYPKGMSPNDILNDYPAEIAYTVGATSGEVCAKVATGGKASIAVPDHRAAADSVRSGRAKAAFVKNFWWEDHKESYPELASYSIDGISDLKNADNVLLASIYVAPEVKALVLNSAMADPDIFSADVVVPFDSSSFAFTMELMKKAEIDPLTYRWPASDSMPCITETTKKQEVTPSREKAPSLDGQMILEKNCGGCHLVEKVKKYRRKTREQWQATVSRKVDSGVVLTEAEQAALIDYLVSLKRKKK